MKDGACHVYTIIFTCYEMVQLFNIRMTRPVSFLQSNNFIGTIQGKLAGGLHIFRPALCVLSCCVFRPALGCLSYTAISYHDKRICINNFFRNIYGYFEQPLKSLFHPQTLHYILSTPAPVMLIHLSICPLFAQFVKKLMFCFILFSELRGNSSSVQSQQCLQ